MTLNDWLATMPRESTADLWSRRRALMIASDAWRAGAKAMLEAMIMRGYVDDGYELRAAARTIAAKHDLTGLY